MSSETITTILHSKKRTNKIPPPATSPATPPRVYLFTHTRVASNLLIKILNLAEQNIPPRALGGYFFIKPWQKPRLLGFGHKSVDLWAPGDIEMIKSMNQECYEDLISWLDAAAKDAKIGFVKEHTLCLIDPALKIPSAGGAAINDTQFKLRAPDGSSLASSYSKDNPTLLPDNLLLSFLPSFLIRHPVLIFPSFYRAHCDIFLRGSTPTPAELEELLLSLAPVMTLTWMRQVYTFYSTSQPNSPPPIILDADDIILNPSIVTTYVKLVGLDPSKLLFEWEVQNQEEFRKHAPEMPQAYQRMMDTVFGSTGIRKDKVAGETDLDVEEKKWKAEFGDVVATTLRRWTDAAVGDYHFLRERRLRPEV